MTRRAAVARGPERIEGDAADATGARVRAIWEQRSAREGRGSPVASFHGRRVLTLESRRSPELALLVMNYGGTPFVAPALREVPLESNQHVLAFAQALIEGRFDMAVLMTGVGVRLMISMIEPVFGRPTFLDALGRTRIVARGPKPVAALREVGLTPWATAPSPNTWRELLATLDDRGAEVPLSGLRLALQEYGMPNPDLVHELATRGAQVVSVPIYRWSMPDDVAPLRRAVWAIVRHEIDFVVLTASIQLVHLLQVAAEMNLEAAVRRAFENSIVIASVGPMVSEELRRNRLPVDIEPSHPKMGFLIKEAAEQCEPLLQAKRSVELMK